MTQAAIQESDILGRWWVRSWTQDYDDGRVTHPMGESLTGFVQYDAGRMVCMIASNGRSNFVTGGQWNASVAEKAAAYDSMLSYAGSYSLLGDEIHHHVDLCLFPNWVGGVQKRRARLEDSRLYLEARLEAGTPEARTARLVWDRTPLDR